MPVTPPAKERTLSYVIAAYGIVIGTLVGYGFWLQRQRRRLIRQEQRRLAGAGGEARGS